ncbi:MAG: 4Fe-4S cluster-binding domain-containing protein [Planctomycetes bacterium]|nr:4Fe-4S cluster-binding domain-containing protein [Planctomycetota bacterium]
MYNARMSTLPAHPQLQALRDIVTCCTLCPRKCRVNRTIGEVGRCGIGAEAVVVSAGAHFGEESCLSGPGGSGTIFFAGCNLACVFCQNADISRSGKGQPVSAEGLATLALELQRHGCANINFVTPTHVAHAMAEAIVRARAGGLTVPVVYNSGGYDLASTLRLLEGLIEVYMPDFKWADAQAAGAYSAAPDYPQVAREALEEMYRQVGPLVLDDRGLATRGVLVRHLVMPDDLAASHGVIDIVADAAPGCSINIMAQYHPAFHDMEYPALAKTTDPADIVALRDYARDRGLRLVD